MSSYAGASVVAGGAYMISSLWQLQCVRHRASISSFKQWKDLLIFKRYDGHHVWCLPQQKPDEYGFRRIARKPPFFKMRKQSFPKITREYSASHALNRTLQIEYNWNGYAALYHEFNDTVQEHMPGVRINAIQKSVDTTLKVMAEDGRVIFDAATDSYTDVHDLVKQCYRKMLEH